MWAHGFRDSFTPLQEVLFTFPSRYLFTIGLRRVFSLGGWSRRIHTGFHVPRATQEHRRPGKASRKGLSPAAARLSRLFRSPSPRTDIRVLQPRVRRDGHGLGSAPFARHYWGYHVCFLFLRLLRCFSSPRSPPHLNADDGTPSRRVAPFGHRGVTGRLRLTPDFRSLPRPSSPSGA